MPESVKQQRHGTTAEKHEGSSQGLDEGLDNLSLLHQSIGNRAVGQLFEAEVPIQRLAVTPNAQAVADQGLDTISMLHQSIGNRAVGQLLGRAAPVQRIAATGQAPAGDEEQTLSDVEAARGGGSTLDEQTRASMETSLGQDFSKVRIHTDGSADAMSRRLNARAFTAGSNIFFRSDAYSPGSDEGQRTLAHELTHVAQQAGRGTAPSRAVSQPDDPAEVEAAGVAKAFGNRITPLQESGDAAIHRDGDEEDKPKLGASRNPEASTGGDNGGSGEGGGAGNPPAANAGSGSAAPGASGSAPPAGPLPNGPLAPSPVQTPGPLAPSGGPSVPATPGKVPPPAGPQTKDPNASIDPGQGGSSQGVPASTDPGQGGSSEGPNKSVNPLAPTDPEFDAMIKDAMSSGDIANFTRLGLEITRPIPGLGLVTGAAADLISWAQDLSSVPGNLSDSPLATTLIVIRNVINLVNNAVGSLGAIVETTQDAATASVAAAPADAVTAPTNVTLSTIKGWLDVAEVTADILVIADAAYNAAHTAPGKDHDAWNSILAGYEANILGDVLNTIIDIVNASTAGGANGNNLSRLARAGIAVAKVANKIKPHFISYIVGFGTIGLSGPFGLPSPLPQVGSGDGSTPVVGPDGAVPVQKLGADDVGAVASSTARGVAISIVRDRVQQMKGAYTVVDTALTLAAENQDEATKVARDTLTQLLDGKDPIKLIVTTAVDIINKTNNEVSGLIRMKDVSATAGERTKEMMAKSQEVRTNINSIPKLSLDVGSAKKEDTSLLDDAQNLLQKQVVDRINARVNAMIDEAKAKVLRPLDTFDAHASEAAEFSVFVQNAAVEMIQKLQDRAAKFAAALAKCSSVEDIVNTMIQQVYETLGAGEGFSIQDVRDGWRDIGPQLDALDAKLQAIGTGGTAASPEEAPGATASLAPPAAPPEA